MGGVVNILTAKCRPDSAHIGVDFAVLQGADFDSMWHGASTQALPNTGLNNWRVWRVALISRPGIRYRNR